MFTKFMSTHIEDRQETFMVAQSDGMIALIQESATSIQTIPFCDDIVSVTMLQELE